MNIFAVNNDPRLAAQDLPDKLVVKMSTESLQLLTPWAFNTHGVYIQKRDETNSGTKGFAHHPCAKWLYESSANVDWLLEHAFEMCREYSQRYGKSHGVLHGLEQVDKLVKAKYRPMTHWCDHTEFVQAMPEEFKIPGDPVTAYRNYINGYKGYAEWRYSEKPTWWDEAKHEPVRKQYLADQQAKKVQKANVNQRVQGRLQDSVRV